MRGYLASMLVLAVTLLIAACGESGTPVDSDGPVSGNRRHGHHSRDGRVREDRGDG